MTFSTPRPTRPATKLLFATVIAFLALLGSVGLVALSGQGNAQALSDPGHAAAMRARTDAIFEVDDPLSQIDGAVTPTNGAGFGADDVVTSERRQRSVLTVSINANSSSSSLHIEQLRRRWIEVRRYWARWRRAIRPTRGVPAIVERPPSTTIPTATTTPKDTTPRDTSPPETITVPETTKTPTTTTTPKTTGTPPPTASPSPAPTRQPQPTPQPQPAPQPQPTPQPQPQPAPDAGVYRVTVGSGAATAFDSSSPAGAGSAHGTRVYCVISHFSHDDPVVFPRRPGASHAHMYWGNTEANAASTGDSLLRSGHSSCEGGTTNRSAYWIPAFFNSSDEAVLPESVFVYYKSFGGPAFGRSTIKPIPAGLEMLATQDVRGAGEWDFQVGGNGSETELKLVFPSCIAVDGAGGPVLSSEDNIAHLAYPTEHSSTSGCPASHPYRVPTLSYIVRFAVAFSSDWYLASDESAATKGQSLHGDYVAAWDTNTMDQLVE